MPVVKGRLNVMGNDHQSVIKVIREVTKEMYTEEDDETKAIVTAKVAAAAGDSVEADKDEEGATRTPQEYQEYVLLFRSIRADAHPTAAPSTSYQHILMECFKPLSTWPDWVSWSWWVAQYQTQMDQFWQAGEQSRTRDIIFISDHRYSVHIGKNSVGNTFGMAFKDFDSTITHPFQQFLRNVYCVDFWIYIWLLVFS